MSISYSGTLRRSKGIISAITKEMKNINLKGVKRLTVTFDPFSENAASTREFLFLLSSPKVTQTNPNCVIKTDVVCNRQPSEVKFSLIESAQEQLKLKNVRFITDNLTTLELLKLCNNHVSKLAPPEDLTIKTLTKSEKQKLAGGKKQTATKKK